MKSLTRAQTSAKDSAWGEPIGCPEMSPMTLLSRTCLGPVQDRSETIKKHLESGLFIQCLNQSHTSVHGQRVDYIFPYEFCFRLVSGG